MQEVLNPQVQTNEYSEGARIYGAIKNGSISQEEGCVSMAMLTVSLLDGIKPRYYQVIPKEALAYCGGRAGGNYSYSQQNALILGEWYFSTIKAIESNSSEVSHLLWCKEKLETKSAESALRALTRKIDDFSMISPPFETLRLALRVKKMDATARAEFGKGGGRQ